MTFHQSALPNTVIVRDGHRLEAHLQTADRVGSRHSGVDLNEFLGNNNGRFEWGGKNFSHSAENIRFAFEGQSWVPVLRARLRAMDGSWRDADVNLAERFHNSDGYFVFK